MTLSETILKFMAANIPAFIRYGGTSNALSFASYTMSNEARGVLSDIGQKTQENTGQRLSLFMLGIVAIAGYAAYRVMKK